MFAIYAAGERGAQGALRDGATVVVVVDAFRASMTIAVLARKGARVVPVASIDEAASYAGADYRIGERDSAKVDGFDFGNSPTEVEAAEPLRGAAVVLSTTNGTRVIEAARGIPTTLTGAFVNAHAVAADLLIDGLRSRVAVIGYGWEGHGTSEDEAAAGAILHRLSERGVELDERAERIVDQYLSRPKKVPPPEQRRPASRAFGPHGRRRFLPRREHRPGRPPARRRGLYWAVVDDFGPPAKQRVGEGPGY